MTLIFEAQHRLGQFSVDAAFTSTGGITALFGRSGSGKTSIVRTIAGLTRPDHGRIVLDGTVLLDTAKGIFVPRHKRRFGYVFQEARLFPHLSVRHNLGYGRWFAPKSGRAESFERVVTLLGIGSLLDRNPEKLSGGEKQRVAIGRALLSDPRMLLMDEPLAALDDARKAEILPYLERLRDEMRIPIVYVSHSVSEVARLADSVVILANGKVEAMGKAAEVLSEPGHSDVIGRSEAGSVLSGIVSAIDRRHGLVTVRVDGAELHLPNVSAEIGSTVRIHIPARDVMLATVRPEGLSALNILQGTIGAVIPADDGMVGVRVDCGGNPVIARITALSRERLGLEAGRVVYAIIKTVALETR